MVRCGSRGEGRTLNTPQTHNITRQVVVKKKAAGDDGDRRVKHAQIDVHRVNAFS